MKKLAALLLTLTLLTSAAWAYTPEEKAAVAACCALAKAVKSVLDTPILTEEGTLTPESGQISASVQAVIAENAE